MGPLTAGSLYLLSTVCRLKDNQTALHVATRVGDLATVELLISRGADINAVTADLYTPLHIAAKEAHDDVAHLLLQHRVSTAPTTKVSLTDLNILSRLITYN